MSFYDRAYKTSVRLLNKYGMTMHIEVEAGEPEYVPGVGMVGGEPELLPLVGVKLDYKQNEIDGTVILQGDQRVYISPEAESTPQTGDILIVSGSRYRVMESRPLSPAGKVVLHDVQVRGV